MHVRDLAGVRVGAPRCWRLLRSDGFESPVAAPRCPEIGFPVGGVRDDVELLEELELLREAHTNELRIRAGPDRVRLVDCHSCPDEGRFCNPAQILGPQAGHLFARHLHRSLEFDQRLHEAPDAVPLGIIEDPDARQHDGRYEDPADGGVDQHHELQPDSLWARQHGRVAEDGHGEVQHEQQRALACRTLHVGELLERRLHPTVKVPPPICQCDWQAAVPIQLIELPVGLHGPPPYVL